MFAAFALMGDLGCTGGPAAVGLVSGDSTNISKGLSVAVVFPALLAVCLMLVRFGARKKAGAAES